MAENFGGISVQKHNPFEEICNFGGNCKNCVFRELKVLARDFALYGTGPSQS